MKMGLWEMTSTSTISGQMPLMDTSKMTPEQRAKIEESMKAMMGPHTNVTRSCVTKEKLEKSVFMMPEQQGQTCKQQVVTNTRSALEAKLICTGQHPMFGQLRIDTLSPTAIKATVTSVPGDKGQSVNVTITLAGKWLGADCGDAK